jgi:hypothetical protein
MKAIWRAALCVMVLGSAAAAETLPSVGVMADAGLPDGAMASIVYRPFNALRLHAGVGNNAISTGVRAGFTLVPFKSVVTPTLSFDYGHYPEGDANPIVERFFGDEYSAEMLEHIGYDFANAHLGFAFGRKRATFYVQGGMSRTTATLHDDSTTVNLTMWSPSARIGLVVYFL